MTQIFISSPFCIKAVGNLYYEDRSRRNLMHGIYNTPILQIRNWGSMCRSDLCKAVVNLTECYRCPRLPTFKSPCKLPLKQAIGILMWQQHVYYPAIINLSYGWSGRMGKHAKSTVHGLRPLTETGYHSSC